MTDDQFYFLAGEVNALHAIVLALVNTHPDPARLGAELESLVELQIALTTPIPLSEKYLDGQENTIKHFTSRIGELITAKGN
jgi:hypothetical protein